MIIDKPWEFSGAQEITIGEKRYNAKAAIFESQGLEVKELRLDEFNIDYPAPCRDNFRDFCGHVMLVMDADLSYPIILNQDGCIIDGKHRLARALIDDHKTIKAVRFDRDPASIWEHADGN